MLEFKKFIEQNTVGTHNDGPGGAFLGSDFSGSEMPNRNYEGNPLWLPSVDMQLPTVTVTDQIREIRKKQDPILIILQKGTTLRLTYDEFRRIHGTPEVGRTITVIFQRNPKDKSEIPSQVQNITVH